MCEDKNRYRAELGGQLGIANVIESIDIPQEEYSIKIACNRLAALDKVGMKVEYIKSSSKHDDMVLMISELWSGLSFNPLPTHVYGHQDNSNRQMNRL